MKNILVTGGLGFIGSHMSRLLVQSGYDVTIVDKETYAADIRRIEDIKDKIDICNVDICDDFMMEPIINYADIIINFAAETHVDNSIKDSQPFIHSNYLGVHNLLETVRKNKENGNDIRMVQISTDEVYGSIVTGVLSAIEYTRLLPGNPYSATKAAADLLCLSYINTYGLDICITRSSNNYGPFQDKEKFIPRMISLAMEGKDLEVYGVGDNIRDWLYVTDNCKGILKVMESGRSGNIYNIGAGNERNNNEVAKIIADRFGVGIKYIEDRAGHDFRYSIDSSKIRNELGWKAEVRFEEGLEETINFYKENR